MLAKHIIVVKGFVEGWNLYRDNGKVYNLLNGYALSDTREHGFFQIHQKGDYYVFCLSLLQYGR
jgi:hypothetical protein